MDYDEFDKQVLEKAMRRVYGVEERLPEAFSSLLDRIADADRAAAKRATKAGSREEA